jgi:3,4-dehydroadipyl-CoA semialdehyde dehydrogenase
MVEALPNYLAGRFQISFGPLATLFDPVRGEALVAVSAKGLDLRAGLAYAREQGGAALRALSYRKRAALLGAAAKTLKANRDAYFEISTVNSGTVKSDSAMDIDGAIFTLGHYAKLGESLGDAELVVDGPAVELSKDGSFQSQHVLVPATGLALFINAFNFPAWGLWEKAAPAILSGVPVVVKPATATAWLAQRMVKDVVEAEIFPPGALSVICGEASALLDELEPFDVVSFTGSRQTAARVRSHPRIVSELVRTHIEADSLNSALLMPETKVDDETFRLLVREVVREMTVKSGQKCTAIRRIFVPEELYPGVAEAIGSKLSTVTVGDPRNETVRMGSLVSRAQLAAVEQGLDQLRRDAAILHDGRSHALIVADPRVAACIGPTLLGATDPDGAGRVHDTEVFGPVATLMPYKSLAHALSLVRRGQGSLVTSLYGSDDGELLAAATALSATNGRVHVVSPDVASSHTGHGNVMPMSVHGGPGRAGGSEELGGLRALAFYHQRTALQASRKVLAKIPAPSPHKPSGSCDAPNGSAFASARCV